MSDLSAIFLPLLQSPEFQETLKAVVIQALNEFQPIPDPVPPLYSRRETCKRLRVSMPTLEKYIREGLIKASKLGNRILISGEAIDNALIAIPAKRRA
jgi:excisionase family DNA binding protein